MQITSDRCDHIKKRIQVALIQRTESDACGIMAFEDGYLYLINRRSRYSKRQLETVGAFSQEINAALFYVSGISRRVRLCLYKGNTIGKIFFLTDAYGFIVILNGYVYA